MQWSVHAASSTVFTIIAASGKLIASFHVSLVTLSDASKPLLSPSSSSSSCHCHKLIKCNPYDVTLLHLDIHSVSNFIQCVLDLSSYNMPLQNYLLQNEVSFAFPL